MQIDEIFSEVHRTVGLDIGYLGLEYTSRKWFMYAIFVWEDGSDEATWATFPGLKKWGVEYFERVIGSLYPNDAQYRITIHPLGFENDPENFIKLQAFISNFENTGMTYSLNENHN